MNIYDLDIHKKCGSYSSPDDAAFKSIDNRENSDSQFIETKMTHAKLIFVLQGEMKLKINKSDVKKVREGYFTMVPCNSYLLASVEPESFVLTCDFSEKDPFCNRYSLVNLMHDTNSSDETKETPSDDTSLSIHPRIDALLRHTMDCMADGLSCPHFHNLKKEELFLLLCAYYTKEQLVGVFRPLFCSNRQFEQMVLNNYEHVTDVKHFAAIAHMPVTTFQRRFKKYFKTSVKQWLLDRKAERMLDDIRRTNRTITDLSQKYGFSSVSYFSNFCKHYFGKTPTELRAESSRNDRN